jgi:hypothetical protein
MITTSLKDYEMHKFFKGKNSLLFSLKKFLNNRHKYTKVDAKGKIYWFINMFHVIIVNNYCTYDWCSTLIIQY